MTTWPLNQRTLAIVERAKGEHFTIRPCERCGGPDIASKVRPLTRCFRCGRQRELEAVAPAVRRWKCGACRRFYRAVLGRERCPECVAKNRQIAARERNRAQRRSGRPNSARNAPDFVEAFEGRTGG